MARDDVHRRFGDLLARFMPFDLVIDEETAWGESARVSKTSVAGTWGAIAGSLRFFADRQGIPRASIEGTQVAYDSIRRYARRSEPELRYDARRRSAPLSLTRKVEYYGFELEREAEGIEEFPPELAQQARRVLADALARGEARHVAVRKNQASIEEARELYRRSGGRTPRLGLADLTALYEAKLADVHSMQDFARASLRLDLRDIVSSEERERLLSLPGAVEIRDRTVAIDYDVEAEESAEPGAPATPVGVARLRLPEKLARTMSEAELPALDRPLRFMVMRGQRGSLRARTLEELQELLDRPWMPDEAEMSPTDWRDDRANRGAGNGGGDRNSRDDRSQGSAGRKRPGGPPGGGKGLRRRKRR
jgi:hypothetical protein